MLKKAAAIFLLSIFLFNTMGYFVAFKLSQLEIKEAIKKDIENGIINNTVSTFVITHSQLADINWVEENEFEYNGERYDVLNKKEKSGQTTFYCINDQKESILNSNMDQHIKNDVSGTKSEKKSGSKTSSENVVKIIKNMLFSFDSKVTSSNKNTFIPFLLNYKFALIKASFQPPELA